MKLLYEKLRLEMTNLIDEKLKGVDNRFNEPSRPSTHSLFDYPKKNAAPSRLSTEKRSEVRTIVALTNESIDQNSSLQVK